MTRVNFGWAEREIRHAELAAVGNLQPPPRRDAHARRSRPDDWRCSRHYEPTEPWRASTSSVTTSPRTDPRSEPGASAPDQSGVYSTAPTATATANRTARSRATFICATHTPKPKIRFATDFRRKQYDLIKQQFTSGRSSTSSGMSGLGTVGAEAIAAIRTEFS